MNHTSIAKLIQTCSNTLRQLDFKESTIKRHQRNLHHLKDYMMSNGQNLYNEKVGEKYQLNILTEGNVKDYRLKEIKHSLNLLNDLFNHVPVRKKRVLLKTFPLPGEIGKHIQSFLEKIKIEKPPYRENNANVYVSIGIRCYRAEKLPSIYNTDEIRKMDASIEKSSPTGKRNYAIFMLASRLGLRASDIRLLQFHDLDWDQNVINLVQCKTQKKIELPLLSIIGEAIIDYVRCGRPKSDNKTIFLTAQAPYTPISVPGLSSIVSHIIYKAGIDTKDRHHGAHCLRHSLATRLLEQGTLLPVISDALGHSDSQTTMVYLSVEINGLLRCSLDVPPVTDHFYMQKGGWFYE